MVNQLAHLLLQIIDGHLIGNAPIITWVFASILKWLAFEWFHKLEPESINSWNDIENAFFTRIYVDDMEISMLALLTTKQKKDEPIRDFIKRFYNISLWYPHGMLQKSLVENCGYNIFVKDLLLQEQLNPKLGKN